MKSTKKSLLLSTLSLIMCVAMLIGTTYAWFTDSVTSGKNKIQAGNLDIEMTHDNGKSSGSVDNATDLFQVDLWEPGVIAYENFTISNVGSLALKFNLALLASNFNTVQGTTKSLKDVIKVAVINDGSAFGGDRGAAQELTYSDFDTALTSLTMTDTAMDAGAVKKLSVVLYWIPSDIDDDYNMKNGRTTSDGAPLFIDLGIALTATQLTKELDSFGPDYDEAARTPALPKVVATSVSGQMPATTDAPTTLKSGDVTVEIPAIDENSPLSNKSIELAVETSDVNAAAITYDISLYDVVGEDKTPITDAKGVLTVKINIGKNLKGVKVSHKGTPLTEATTGADQTFSYDKTTGILVINSSTFSPFTVNYDESWESHAAESYSTPVDTANKIVTVSSAEELALFAFEVNHGKKYPGYTLKITKNIDLGGYNWVPINGYKDGNLSNLTIDGGNHTISNMRVIEAINENPTGYNYYIGFIGQVAGKLTVKDLTFDKAEVSDIKASGAAVVVGLTYAGPTFENVTVKNSTVNACTKAGAILGFTGGDGVTVTLKGCKVENTVVNADYSYAVVVGLVQSIDNVEFNNCAVTKSSAKYAGAFDTYDDSITEGDYTYGKNSDGSKGFVTGVNNAWAEKRNTGASESFLHGNGTL